MAVREDFENLLAEFVRESGVKIDRGEEGSATVAIGEERLVLLNLEFLPESGSVLAWAAVGNLGDDENAPARAEYLMSVNDREFLESGFVLAQNAEDGLGVAHDVRRIEWFDSADRFAAWLEALYALVCRVRIECDERFPYVDDGELVSISEEV